MANTVGEKELKTNWPVVTGLELVDKHEGRVKNLIPLGIHGVHSVVSKREEVGL